MRGFTLRATSAFLLTAICCAGIARAAETNGVVPEKILLRILAAEDERRWDNALAEMLKDPDAAVRRRAALSAGRIGDDRAVAPLTSLLLGDADTRVRAMAAFALGEIESDAGGDALLTVLAKTGSPAIRARALEALGKIAAALPKQADARRGSLGAAIAQALQQERERGAAADRSVILLGLTAVLRARPADAGAALVPFLASSDARVREDAANALARLRLKDGLDQLRTLLTEDPDPIVRANAARVLGAAADLSSLDALLAHATQDSDARVRISAIRALGTLKDFRVALALLDHGEFLWTGWMRSMQARGDGIPGQKKQLRLLLSTPGDEKFNELLEVAATLGRLLEASGNERAIELLRRLRDARDFVDPEVEIAYARISPGGYIGQRPFVALQLETAGSTEGSCESCTPATAMALAELAKLVPAGTNEDNARVREKAQQLLREQLSHLPGVHNAAPPFLAQPEVLRAIAAYKTDGLRKLLLAQLRDQDVIVRSTAAELLAELPADAETTAALIRALTPALRDIPNDAALSILDTLGKFKTPDSIAAIQSALGATNYIVRKKAVALLREAGKADANLRAEPVKSRNTPADYKRAIARRGKRTLADVETDKGTFTIELLAEEAPLTVDNFVSLAKKNFFNHTTFHRVVPNFVIQGGDPRGDGNGGPGYEIRCEINEVPYERSAVGMALSGKDTGGSQWFVTHSPQPHLDGGYTVFGRIVSGMDVVDRISRGDRIRRVTIQETAGNPPSSTTPEK